MGFLRVALFASQAAASVTLFNGAQQVLFDDAPQACLDAFNAQLSCDAAVQQLSFDLDKLALTPSNLTSLCTHECGESLVSLKSSVRQKCGDYDFYFNGGYWHVVDVIDLYLYKYAGVCMRDKAGDLCLAVEETWDIGALDRAGQATWPAYTNKTFPNWEYNDDGSPTLDDDGLLIDDSNDVPQFQDLGIELEASASDFYLEGISPDWVGHGWDGILEYDEYPLEIQCSECFLAQYRHGLESKWGEMYDDRELKTCSEVSAQVWDNMKRNCKLDWDLKPANDFSQHGLQHNITALVWDKPIKCEQNITRNEIDLKSCGELGLEWSIPSAALSELNGVNCAGVSDGTFCAPESCAVAVVQDICNPMDFLKGHPNITMTQLVTWNPYMNLRTLKKGETICIGPPGGKYIPIFTTLPISSGQKSSTTTTSTITSVSISLTSTSTSTTSTVTKPSNGIETPAPVQPDIVGNCNKFYWVKKGDDCSGIASKNGVSLEDVLSWNPKAGQQCTGLMADTYACVSIIGYKPPPTNTKPSNGVETPSPTQPGLVDYCEKFVYVKPGDSCADIASAAGISASDFSKWNSKVGSQCGGLWADAYACVGVLPGFRVKTRYHADCTGDVHNEVSVNGGVCINTDCRVASLEIAAQGYCPDGEVQISYWEEPDCGGRWFGYGYTNRGQCRSLWTEGWKFKAIHFNCASKETDCITDGSCKFDAEPSHNLC